MSGSMRPRDSAAELGLAAGGRPSLLTVCDEWLPRRGGISRFNRSLTIAAAACGYRTVCLVGSASTSEIEDAAAHDVTLLLAEKTPAGPNIYVPARAVLDANPDVVIGHDVVSGSPAWVYAKRYLQAKLVYIVHTTPSENEPYKRATEAVRRTLEREGETRRIADDADVVAAVGPRLARRAEALIGDGFADARVLRLDPGIDLPPDGIGRERRVPAYPTVLVLGRTTHIVPKGLDIVARAVAGLTVPHGRPIPDLRIRGAPDASCDELRHELVQQSEMARDRIDVRPFTADLDEIQRDLMRSAVCVMPSRAEGFGLGALEAIGMGTPVLVSARSGLAEVLLEFLGPAARAMIVDVTDHLEEDVPRWKEAIQLVLDDLPARFTYTHEIRSKLRAVLRWDLTVDALIARLAAVPTQRSSS
jgi:glycosyltransferase involved in cell wall biosynthesis